jgi:hypothetical protein
MKLAAIRKRLRRSLTASRHLTRVIDIDAASPDGQSAAALLKQ